MVVVLSLDRKTKWKFITIDTSDHQEITVSIKQEHEENNICRKLTMR